MNKSLNVGLLVGLLALSSVGAGCGGDDDGGGSGGSATGGGGTAGGGGSGGLGGASSGGMAGAGTGGTGTGGTGTGGVGTGGTGTGGSGTGGSATGGSGGGGGTHQTCTDAGAKMAAMAAKNSCTDNSVAIQTGCEGLYSSNTCVQEWEALIACALALPESAWECNSKNNPDFKAGNCTSQKTTFDACTP